MKKLFCSTFLVGFLLVCQIALCQQLTIENEEKQILLSRADIEALPHASVIVEDHSGAAVQFEGAKLASVLGKAGISLGESMKGQRLAGCLLVEAADGYRAVIALRNRPGLQ